MTADDGRDQGGDASTAAAVAAELSDVLYAIRLEPDMAFEYVSPSVEALVGYTPEEHYSDPLLGTRLLDPRDADVLARSTQAEIGEPVEFTVRWRAKNGRAVWTQHRCRKQRRDDGSVVLYGSARDVTTAHEEVEWLAAEEQRYRLLAEQSADFAFRLDSRRVIDWVSPNVTSLLGWQPDDLVGHFPEEFTHPQDIPADLNTPEYSQAARRLRARVRVATKAGTYRWMDMSAAVVTDASGNVVAQVGSGLDVQAEVDLQHELARASNQLELVLQNTADVVALIGADGVLQWVTPSIQRVFGWSPGDLVGAPFLLAAPDSRASVDAAFSRALREHTDRFAARLQVECADGSLRWADTHNALVWNESGEFDAMVVVLRDVTDLVAAQQIAQRMLEAATDVVFDIAPDNTYRWVSPSVTEMLGWEPAQLVGKSGTDLIHPEDLATIVEAREHPRAGVASVQAFRYRQADGTYRWMSGTSHQVHDAAGELHGRVVGLRDIQSLIEARQKADAASQRSRGLVQALPDPTYVYSAVRDDHGAVIDLRFTDMNEAAGRLYGREPRTVLGHGLLELFPSTKDSGVFDLYVDTLESGKPGTMRLPRFEDRGITKSFDISTTLAGDEVVVVARDITEALAAEQALADAEHRYRLVAENATDAVVVVNLGAVINWVSPAVERVLGYQPAQMLGRSVSSFVHPEDLPLWRSIVALIQAGTEAAPWEFRAATAHGDYRWMSAITCPLLDSDKTMIGRIMTLRDIDQQVTDRRALARSEQTFRLAMAGAPQGMAVVGLHGQFLQVNQVLCDLVGREPAWMLANSEGELLHPEDIDSDLAVRDRLLAGESEYDVHEARLVAADGRVLWVQHSLALVRDEHNMPVFYVSQYQDITAARDTTIDLRYRASHDPLTGLINREELSHLITQTLGHDPRRAGVPAVLYCDVDYFKDINDTHGHSAGDAVLQRTAERIVSVLRDTDHVARLGGDEFVVLLSDVADTAAAVDIAEKIRAAVAQPTPLGSGTVEVSMSIGIALSAPSMEPLRLLRNADQALYRAKERGRDQSAVFGERGEEPHRSSPTQFQP